MLDESHPYMEAARYADAYAEDGGFEHAFNVAGIDMEAVLYVAQQRALRLAIVLSRGEGALSDANAGGRGASFRLSPAEEGMMRAMYVAVMDGLFIGQYAARLAANTKDD